MSGTQHILQVFASRFWGGGEQYVYDLSRNLIKNGYQVSFISRKSTDIESKIQDMPCRCDVLSLKSLFDIWSVYKLSLIINQSDISIIHTHQFKDTFIALFARMISKNKPKVILTRHLVKRAKNNRLYHWLYKNVDKIIFVSYLAMNEFLSTKPVINPAKMTVIHNSIDKSPDVEFKDLRKTYNINENTVLLAFIGRIDREKGIEVLIQSLEKIKEEDFFLFIVGKGNQDYEEYLKTQVKKSGWDERVEFTGFTEHVQAFVKQIDIGIVPSVCRESFGLTVIELMQAGKAIVTTNNGAQPEYITDNETGILVPPNDSDRLGNAMKQLILQKEYRENIGMLAKKFFREQLSYPVFFNKILTVYSEN